MTHISELNQAQLSQLTDTIIGRARLKEELHQAHLLAAKHGAHRYLHNTKDNNTLTFTFKSLQCSLSAAVYSGMRGITDKVDSTEVVNRKWKKVHKGHLFEPGTIKDSVIMQKLMNRNS